MYWLAGPGDAQRRATIHRFDPRFWTVNFPRPMMAAVTTPAFDALTVHLVFYNYDDLAGLIWESEDHYDHPLLAYETRRDYRGLILRFRWVSTTVKALDQPFGPTLTIEGRDAEGAAHTWYVRLWNYAVGAPSDSIITLDFDALDDGYTLPADADPVYAGDIDRMLISMVPPDYDGEATGPVEDPPGTFTRHDAVVEISEIALTGGPVTLSIGDTWVRPHGLGAANGYDDTYNVTPARIVRNLLQLGYRGRLAHYLGMSHFYALGWNAGAARFIADPETPLNAASEAWHQDFFARAVAVGYDVILSLSFELLHDNAPLSWRQLAFDATPALTGWDPPSTLIAPTNADATDYLRDVYLALAALTDAAGGAITCQIGEPWWWYNFADGDKPCFYDSATTALYASETGLAVPTMHESIYETPDTDQQAYLDWLGDKLGAAVIALRDVIKSAYPTAEVALLFYTPQVLNAAAPMLRTVNAPVAHFAAPAFDHLELEDYDFVIAGARRGQDQSFDFAENTLGYAATDIAYFSGFNLLPETSFLWAEIDRAADDARARAVADVIVWAYPQILRDGYVRSYSEEQDVSGFHEVRFQAAIGFGSTGGPQFSTSIVELASGYEQRNVNWSQARARYNLGSGVKSENDLALIAAFFLARRGRAYGFRFKDFADYKSSAPSAGVTALDQIIGMGDGVAVDFPLFKTYASGAETFVRSITKPVENTVIVALDGVEIASGWEVDLTTGVVTFDDPPGADVTVTAGFEFDVPVRFADDALDISAETFGAGQAPDIPIVEIRV
jgi:uncharacterized protein (TIGR02217 family)